MRHHHAETSSRSTPQWLSCHPTLLRERIRFKTINLDWPLRIIQSFALRRSRLEVPLFWNNWMTSFLSEIKANFRARKSTIVDLYEFHCNCALNSISSIFVPRPFFFLSGRFGKRERTNKSLQREFTLAPFYWSSNLYAWCGGYEPFRHSEWSSA